MKGKKEKKSVAPDEGAGGRLARRKAEVLKALAHPVRVSIFETLAEGEKSVGELVELLGTKEANTSRHLAVMRREGLVSARKQGLNVYYSIKALCLLSMLSCLEDGVCAIAEDQAEVAGLAGRAEKTG